MKKQRLADLNITGLNLQRKEMKGMGKIVLFVMLLSLVLGAGIANAGTWTGDVVNNYETIKNVQTFDWSASGSGDAVGLAISDGTHSTPNIPLISKMAVGSGDPLAGTPFTFMYQANLATFNDPNGDILSAPGLNSKYEYTVVATFQEKITAATPVGSGIDLELTTIPGGTFAVYYDDLLNPPGVKSVVSTGKGFNDGTKIASGTIDADQITTFSYNGTKKTGLGSGIIEGLVNSVTPGFFIPDQFIIDFRWEGTENIPAGNSKTSSFFDGNDGFTKTAVAGTDLIQKADGSSDFSVPEPSTFVLLGAGLLGLGGIAWRRKN